MEENKNKITFKPATTQRASDVIYNQIYQKIASGELKVGDRLPPERDLVEQFHRSRPSIREALRMLQQDGLIKISVGTNGGAIVQGISLDIAEQPLRKLVDMGTISLQELADYRVFNDRCCANLAVQNHTEEDAEALREIIRRYGESIYDSDALAPIDIAFHKALAQSSHNKLCILITDVVTTLCTSMFWNIATTEMTEEEVFQVNKRAYENHAQIAEAVISRNLEELNKHIDAATAMFYEATGSVLESERNTKKS